jgi:hypothetical protein
VAEEVERGWLKLTNDSNLVLTSRHVLQYTDRGTLGESRTIIPRHAVTTVRIGWRRSRTLLLLAALLLGAFLLLIFGSLYGSPGWLDLGSLNLSSSTVALIPYLFLIAGVILFLLFWFHERTEIEIAAPSGTIGGVVKNYDEAETFCRFLLAETVEKTTEIPEDSEPATRPKTAGSDWQL